VQPSLPYEIAPCPYRLRRIKCRSHSRGMLLRARASCRNIGTDLFKFATSTSPISRGDIGLWTARKFVTFLLLGVIYATDRCRTRVMWKTQDSTAFGRDLGRDIDFLKNKDWYFGRLEGNGPVQLFTRRWTYILISRRLIPSCIRFKVCTRCIAFASFADAFVTL